MKTVELFEPAMCCATGVCGPSVNPELLMITGAFEAMGKVDGVQATRYNLSNNPDTFSQRADILAAMADDTETNLPITVVDGEIVKQGTYPTLEELGHYTGLVFVPADENKGCCGGSGCC